MMLDRYLEQFVTEFQLAPLPPANEQKQRELKIGDLAVGIKEIDQGIYLVAKIAPVPQAKREELYIHLMKANFLGQGTGGSTIGLLEDESFLTLSLALPYEMNYNTFKETIEDFVNFVDFWKKEVARVGSETLDPREN
jgi:hypothetical protein